MTTATEESQPKTTRRKKAATQSSGTRARRTARTAAKGTPIAEPSQDEIARRAWHIWQEQGCPEGREEQNWLQAEAELRELS